MADKKSVFERLGGRAELKDKNKTSKTKLSEDHSARLNVDFQDRRNLEILKMSVTSASDKSLISDSRSDSRRSSLDEPPSVREARLARFGLPNSDLATKKIVHNPSTINYSKSEIEPPKKIGGSGEITVAERSSVPGKSQSNSARDNRGNVGIHETRKTNFNDAKSRDDRIGVSDQRKQHYQEEEREYRRDRRNSTEIQDRERELRDSQISENRERERDSKGIDERRPETRERDRDSSRNYVRSQESRKIDDRWPEDRERERELKSIDDRRLETRERDSSKIRERSPENRRPDNREREFDVKKIEDRYHNNRERDRETNKIHDRSSDNRRFEDVRSVYKERGRELKNFEDKRLENREKDRNSNKFYDRSSENRRIDVKLPGNREIFIHENERNKSTGVDIERCSATVTKIRIFKAKVLMMEGSLSELREDNSMMEDQTDFENRNGNRQNDYRRDERNINTYFPERVNVKQNNEFKYPKVTSERQMEETKEPVNTESTERKNVDHEVPNSKPTPTLRKKSMTDEDDVIDWGEDEQDTSSIISDELSDRPKSPDIMYISKSKMDSVEVSPNSRNENGGDVIMHDVGIRSDYTDGNRTIFESTRNRPEKFNDDRHSVAGSFRNNHQEERSTRQASFPETRHNPEITMSPRPQESTDLPFPWTRIIPQRGRMYFYNSETRMSVWDLPLGIEPIRDGRGVKRTSLSTSETYTDQKRYRTDPERTEIKNIDSMNRKSYTDLQQVDRSRDRDERTEWQSVRKDREIRPLEMDSRDFRPGDRRRESFSETKPTRDGERSFFVRDKNLIQDGLPSYEPMSEKQRCTEITSRLSSLLTNQSRTCSVDQKNSTHGIWVDSQGVYSRIGAPISSIQGIVHFKSNDLLKTILNIFWTFIECDVEQKINGALIAFAYFLAF
ncbi:hypothetical protein HK096_002408 [Nowakowskiella sp. JEL0078]|nr:hypothetical protein HK096_002408 [Nowakowskiella sp. JEL0078]